MTTHQVSVPALAAGEFHDCGSMLSSSAGVGVDAVADVMSQVGDPPRPTATTFGGANIVSASPVIPAPSIGPSCNIGIMFPAGFPGGPVTFRSP